jgi:hypothetical protein
MFAKIAEMNGSLQRKMKDAQDADQMARKATSKECLSGKLS